MTNQGQFGLGLSRNTLTKESAPKTIRSMRRCKSTSSFYVSFSRGGLHDNIGPFKVDLFPGLWNADLYCKLLLAETFGRPRKDLHDKCRTDCQDLDQGMKQLPVGNGSAELIVVKYPSDGGYTPGDTWDLYVGKDNRVEQFVYHRGGPKKPSAVIATWEGYKKAGPLLISTDHHGTADGNPLRIFISDVSVKLTGSENWINAQ